MGRRFETLGARALALAVLLGSLAGSAAAQGRPLTMIDAGHGGDELGVAIEGLEEKEVVLSIAFVVASEFVDAGHDVRFTRTGDYAVWWDERRRAAEEVGASLLLMLHTNGNDDSSVNGAEVYAYAEEPASRDAAAHIARALRHTGLQVVEEPRDWPFLQSPDVATVMLELAHLTNPTDRRLLLSDDFRHELGERLVAGAEAWRRERR